MRPGRYLFVGITAARSNLAYVGEVVARTVFLGVILFIFLQLWRATFEQTGEERLGGLTLAQMLWYLAVTESLVLSTPAVSTEVDQDVRTGALAVQMVRPLSYPLYRLGASIGERVVRFGMNVVVASAIAFAFVGPIPLSPDGLVLFLAAVPLAFVLDFLVFFLIGVCAFWLENTTGLTLVYSRVTMILGGMLLPIDLFPDGLRAVVQYLPFASVIYGPSRMFVLPDATFLAGLLARQLVAVGILGVAVALVYRAAVRRVFSNGG
jgi:ABC-2 type transport system permease protein